MSTEKRSTSRKAKSYVTPYGELTAREVLGRHEHKGEITIQIVSGRLSRRGGMCPSLWYPKCTPVEFWRRLIDDGLETALNKEYTRPVKPLVNKLDRDKCRRNSKTCAHYSACTDSIVFNQKMPARHQHDRSCFVVREDPDLWCGSDRTACVPDPVTRFRGHN